MKKTILILTIVFLLIQCKNNSIEKIKNNRVLGFIADSAMVVSARKEASEIGTSILKMGGNAFDAMVATELALAVSYPVAGNIGGGGFMVYRTYDGKTGTLDYREKAPLAASKNMYLDDNGNLISDNNTLGAMAIGVPGTIAGIFEVHSRFGSIPMNQLIQPAIDLAQNGIIVTKKQANSLNSRKNSFGQANNYKIHLDTHWSAGDTIKFHALAATLIRIRNKGRDEFYKGETAKLIVDYVQALGGILTAEDFVSYNAKWRNPVSFNFKDYTITSMSLPSSGGICLAQILKAVEPYNLDKLGHNSAAYIQLLTEAERRSYADRAHYLGDPDFISVDIDSLISTSYIEERMKNFDWKKATNSTDISYGTWNHYESNETTHYSIVDKFGNAVAATTTLNTGYGSKVYVKGAGFFLNNEMDDFSAKPGIPNSYGLVGSEANAIAPEKRMLSSMTPAIITKNNKLKMVIGSPGGSTIITSVLQNILNVIVFDMGMQEAINKPRFHHQWLPDLVKMESYGFDSITINELGGKGYNISAEKNIVIGRVDAIMVLPNGKLEGGADARGDDKAIGF